jgi:hypothetical protein
MVYTKIKDGKVLSFVVTCNCGCTNGIEFKVLDDCVFISSFSGDFYNKQNIFSYMGKEYVINTAKHKGIYLSDCCLDKEDIKDFLYAINNLYVDKKENSTPYTKGSYLSLYRDEISDDIEIFGIALRPKMKLLNLLLHDYRAYDVVYTFNEWKHFVNICNKKFADLVEND